MKTRNYSIVKWGDYWMVKDWPMLYGYLFLEWSDAIHALSGDCSGFLDRLALDYNGDVEPIPVLDVA